jgi:mRNA-degrading endonuclease YafQ of YafQ-DinJ toxin-antitoxin module
VGKLNSKKVLYCSMQTFLPYKSFKQSLQSLDYRRLGKQRVEAFQILNVLLERTDTKGWRNHPITKMWKGYEDALKQYFNKCVYEWVERGYNNNMLLEKIEETLPLKKQNLQLIKI